MPSRRARRTTIEQAALRARMRERRWMLAAACVVLLAHALTYHAKTGTFVHTEVLLKSGEVVDLSRVESTKRLRGVFSAVYDDPADRRVAAEHVYDYVVRRRSGRLLPWVLDNVGQLNTAALRVPAARAREAGPVFRRRLADADGGPVPLLGDASELRRVKPRLVVRSPESFRWTFWLLVLVHTATFVGVHRWWARRRFAGDWALLPVAYALTGLGLAMMFSMQDPLRDTLRAQGFVEGVVAGGVVLALVSGIDFQRGFWRRRAHVWLALAVATATLLYVFGTGPTGSDAKVNLHVPVIGSVQPVELVKLFVVLFLAGFFARRWAFLRGLAQRDGLPRLLHGLNLPRYRDVWPAVAGLVLALATFYLLRDMGPALVIACTFLVLYGTVRDRWLAVAGGFTALAAAFWYAYRADVVPVVAGRVRMLLSPWENFVAGGEHLAHAYWALATGGVAGRGLGHGSPSYVPAAHTDMVLAAVGEEVGLVGLLAVLVLYAVLVLRTMRISLRAGGVFSLLLGLGIGLLTLFQVVLIGGGVLGLVPLSGVVTPFLSYGKSSMLANFALVGMLASISARPACKEQRALNDGHFRRPLGVLQAAAVVLLAVLGCRAAYVQAVVAEAWLLRPALVVRSSGLRAFTYNPRIYDARRSLTRGSIYDRNGIPLATSRWDEVERYQPVYADLGVDVGVLTRTDGRHYPFGPLTFFLLGDLHSRVKWGAGNSLYAEHTYLSHLRGFDNTPTAVEKKRRDDGDLEPVIRYDYGALLSLVRYGAASREARDLVARPRDLRLTVDVRLQQRVAEVLAQRVPEGKTASVVVLGAASGDVLASVTYPLPQAVYDDPSAAHRDPAVFDRGYGRGAKPPGSTFKLVTAMAALSRDVGADRWTREVHAFDRYARRGEPTGRVDLHRAIVRSSNVFFAALAHDLVGADTLLRVAEALGFGVGPPGLSRREKVDLLKAPDNLRQAGFGQGPVTASPLEVALVSAVVANGGVRPDVRWVTDPTAPKAPARYVVLPAHARQIGRYMRGVVAERGGTAWRLRDLSVPVAGKTGTAEERQVVVDGGRQVVQTVNHAWFTGFAPYRTPGEDDDEPRIAVAVLVEGGGMGGVVAAPIAGAVIEEAAALGLIVAPRPDRSEPAPARSGPKGITLEWLP